MTLLFILNYRLASLLNPQLDVVPYVLQILQLSSIGYHSLEVGKILLPVLIPLVIRNQIRLIAGKRKAPLACLHIKDVLLDFVNKLIHMHIMPTQQFGFLLQFFDASLYDEEK
ncbi:hypothetical protein D3C71_1515100 [compost metagenome]